MSGVTAQTKGRRRAPRPTTAMVPLRGLAATASPLTLAGGVVLLAVVAMIVLR